jgi:hypothetical protein
VLHHAVVVAYFRGARVANQVPEAAQHVPKDVHGRQGVPP